MIVVLVVVGVLVVLGAAMSAVAVTRRRARGPELEPPPAAPGLAPEAPPEEVEEVVRQAEALVTEAEAGIEAAPRVRPRFRDRLGKARGLLSGYVGSMLSRDRIDDETWDELEEALVRADVGVAAASTILEDLKGRVKAEGIASPEELVQALKDDLKKGLASADRGLRHEPGAPNVWLFVGVNGVGKTTTIGKVGRHQLDQGRSVLMAAADTFRAAAGEQLEVWADRVDAPVVRGTEGGDPGAVVFDLVEFDPDEFVEALFA